MSEFEFTFQDTVFSALAAGALFWPEQKLLCVSDLHLGKSDRIARLGGTLLPPYETTDTLARLAQVIASHKPATVVCPGDSFDDLAAFDALSRAEHTHLASLMAGREWVWIEGNHDPGPVDIGGSHLFDLTLGPIRFRHMAQAGETGEISGHYHPKARVNTRQRGSTRPCFLVDSDRIILPAFGAYTGGLRSDTAVLSNLMGSDAIAILTGNKALPVPMPR